MPRIVGTPQEEIDLTLRTLFKTGQVVELRALDYLRQGCTASGYFSHFGLLAEKALELSGQATGVYVTVHELDPALLARACNRIERFPKAVTSDRDVVRYRFLPVDFDPRRPAGISSTEGEHRAALQRAHACRDWLLEQGFPEPLIADSGNGAHILVRIDLPVDPASRTLVERCLKALAAKFSDGAVLVDTGVANPARIWRLYGTRACKGDPTNDRPHRLAHLLRIPKTIVPLTLDQLQRLASLAPSVSATGGQVQAHSRRLKVADWLTDHDQAFRSKDDGESVIFILKTCPFNESHTDKAHIIQSQSGQLRAGCFHASCQGKGWAEFRDAIGKPDHRHYEGGRLPCPNCLSLPLPSKPFPTWVLPNSIRRFVETTAEAFGCDAALLGVPLLSVLGAAVGNSRAIQLKPGWIEPSVVWTIIVADSGMLKSPALNAVLTPSRQLQHLAIRKFQKARERFLAESRKNPSRKLKPPICERYLVSDATVESLAMVLLESPRGLLLARDELSGLFGGFDQYKRAKGADVAQYLEMHGAREMLVDRKTSQPPMIQVPRAAVCITGTIQPQVLQRIIGRQGFENGLMARFLLARPPRQPRVWSDRSIPAGVSEAYAATIRKLYRLRPESETGEPRVLTLSPEAQQRWIRFYNAHGREQFDLEGDLAAFWSKLERGCARLALLLELARWAGNPPIERDSSTIAEYLASTMAPRTVSLASLEAAIELIDWFGSEGKRLYDLFSISEEERECDRLVEWIRARGESVTARDLQRSSRAYRGSAELAEQALQRLVDAKMGEWSPMQTGPKGGHPTRTFRLFHGNESPESKDDDGGGSPAA